MYYSDDYKSDRDERKPKSLLGPLISSAIIGILTACCIWLLHIPLNLNYPGFWIEAVFVASIVAFCISRFVDAIRGWDPGDAFNLFVTSSPYVPARAVAVVIGLMLIGMLAGSRIFSSVAYANRISVKESSFEEWSDDLRIEGISLMDTDSATMVGNRELGSLQDVVSQFDDARYYQVILNGTPQKVAPLQYVGFFSWVNNRKTGAPGYVLVDPIRQNADYYKLESIEGTGDGLRFIPSAYFGDDLQRLLWTQYPTKVLGTPHFELDDEGHPFYVTQSFGFAAFMGARYVEGIVVTDPTDGTSEYYDTSDVPAWLDVVYDGDLLDEMYDDHGRYGNGFFNSIFAKIGCTRTGGDYGYVMIGDEQWIYTGITSMGSDSSNVGFLLASEKTGEAYFLPMASADENSAMTSAEGKVQQYGYDASFPSLVSIDGQPTYVMVLKDGGGLIRLYAMVNAESYNVVACEPDLVSCKSSYEKAMRAAGIEFDDDEQKMPEIDAAGVESTGEERVDGGSKATSKGKAFSAKVVKAQLADDGGDTYLYALCDDGEVYRIRFSEHPKECLSLDDGDRLAGKATEGDGFLDVTELGDED